MATWSRTAVRFLYNRDLNASGEESQDMLRSKHHGSDSGESASAENRSGNRLMRPLRMCNSRMTGKERCRDLKPGYARVLGIALCAIILAGVAIPTAAQEGLEWLSLTLDEAISLAREQDTMVMVDVWAPHCATCGEMEEELWQSPEGAALAEGLIPIKINNQTDEGKAFMAIYPIMGLPAIVFIKPDGSELGRVVGYFNRSDFLRDAQSLAQGIDPLPIIKARLESNPDDLDMMFEVLETCLFRRMEEEADVLYDRILRADPANRQRQAEKAIGKMARYQEYFLNDLAKSAEYWRFLVETFPAASSAGAGAMRVQRSMAVEGRWADWLPWVCDILNANPNAMTLHRSAVQTAMRGGYRDPCLGDAARRVAASGQTRTAYFDSISVILDNR